MLIWWDWGMCEAKIEAAWVEVKLGAIGSFSTSSVDKKLIKGERTVRLINYMDVYHRNIIDASIDFMEVTASSAEIVKSSVERGDILFTPSSETPDDIGHAAVVVDHLPDTLHSYHTVRFRPFNQESIDLDFRAWIASTESVRKQFEQRCAGSTRYTLSLPAFRSAVVAFPKSRRTQKRIAHILQTIDRAIEKTEALIDKYQQIKAGLMRDLFTRGIGPDGQLRPPREQAPELYQETPIGLVPKDWSIVSLNSIVNPQRPIVYGILMPGPSYEGGVPVVKVKDINDRTIKCEGLLLTSPKIDREYSRSRLKTGDILITIRGSVGRICIVPDELDAANITQDSARIDILDGCGRFYSYYLESAPATRYYDINTLGVAVQGINLGELRKLPTVIPGKVEQSRIADALDSMTSKLEAEKRYLTKLQKQKSGLMHDLLTGKVRVQVEEPQADPAPANA